MLFIVIFIITFCSSDQQLRVAKVQNNKPERRNNGTAITLFIAVLYLSLHLTDCTYFIQLTKLFNISSAIVLHVFCFSLKGEKLFQKVY